MQINSNNKKFRMPHQFSHYSNKINYKTKKKLWRRGDFKVTPQGDGVLSFSD